MANILKQSTQIKVRVGPALDATDGVTPETTLTLGAADQAELLKADGAATVDISGATFAAVTGCDGWYDLTLTTSHTDTIGELVVVIQDSSLMLPIFARFQVVEEPIYDALYAASATGFDANGRVDVGEWLGTAVTVSSTTSLPEVDAKSISDDATAANNLELDYDGNGYNKANSTIGTCTANTDMRGTDSAFLAASAPTNFSALGINASGHVSRVTLVDTTTTNTDMRGTDGANTTTPPTAAAVADAVWDEAQADHVAAGSFGLIASEIASILQDTETDGVVLSTATQQSIADALLDRDVENVEDTAAKVSLGALCMFVTNGDSTTNPGFWTAKKVSNDAEFGQYALTSDASAEPTTGVNA